MALSLHGTGSLVRIRGGGDRSVGIRVDDGARMTRRGADASRAAAGAVASDATDVVARLTRDGVTTLRERATRTVVARFGEIAAASTVPVESPRQNFITSSSSPTGRGAGQPEPSFGALPALASVVCRTMAGEEASGAA